MTHHIPHPVPEEPGVFVPVEVRGRQHGYDAGLSRPPDMPRTPGTRHPPCVGEPVLRVMVREFAPGGEAENGVTGRVPARACADEGVPRLYLSVHRDSLEPGAEPAGDPLRDMGRRHGPVYQSLGETARQVRPQVRSRVPHFEGVRYGPAAEHHFFDLLPQDGLLAGRF